MPNAQLCNFIDYFYIQERQSAIRSDRFIWLATEQKPLSGNIIRSIQLYSIIVIAVILYTDFLKDSLNCMVKYLSKYVYLFLRPLRSRRHRLNVYNYLPNFIVNNNLNNYFTFNILL